MEDKIKNVNNEVIQSNFLIESRYSLSMSELKLILLIISKIKRSDEDFKSYKIHINDFLEVLGSKRTRLHSDAPKITKSILSKPLEVKNGKELIQCNWISRAKYIEGKALVECRFDPDLKPYLLQLKEKFTNFELENIIQLKSSYSIRFYQLLKSYEKLKARTIEYSELRWMLSIEKDQYKRFYDFKRRIIEPSRKEIKRVCDDIYFEYETIKKGRYISKIKFIIKQQKQKQFKKKQDTQIIDVKNGIILKDSMVIEYQDKNYRINSGCIQTKDGTTITLNKLNTLYNDGKIKILE